MRIGFDTSTYSLTKGGTTVYLKNLIKNIHKISPSEEIFEYQLSTNKYSGYTISKKLETIYRELIWQQKSLPKMALKDKVNLIHYPNHYCTLNSKLPTIVTFHDIYILRNPQAFTKWHSKFANFLFPKVVKRANHIIAISEFTKNELVQYLDVPEEKITVIYNGVDYKFKTIHDEDLLNQIKNKYKIKNPFLLYVGAIEPRKNINLMINSFCQIRSKMNIDLVVVSFGGWNNKELLNMINESPGKDYIRLLGYLPEEELPVIYNLALGLIYLSSYEGFGLPMVEAMASGCPVIASSNTVAEEIVGKAGALINPNNEEEIVESVTRLLNESYRHEIIEQGLNRAKNFSWEKCAKETLTIYQKFS